MTVLNFNGYRVNYSKYNRNNNFYSENNEIDLSQELEAQMNYDDSSAEIQLSVSIGSIEESNQPFNVEINISGFFTYNIEEDENDLGIEELLKINGSAILYPYIRSLVSSLTAMSGEFPGYNMPTINIHKALEKKEDERVD